MKAVILRRSIALLTLATSLVIPIAGFGLEPWQVARCNEIGPVLGAPSHGGIGTASTGLYQRAENIRRDIADLQRIVMRNVQIQDAQLNTAAYGAAARYTFGGNVDQSLRVAYAAEQEALFDANKRLREQIAALQQEQTFVARQISLLSEIVDGLKCPQAATVARAGAGPGSAERSVPVVVEVLDRASNKPIDFAAVVLALHDGTRLQSYTDETGAAGFGVKLPQYYRGQVTTSDPVGDGWKRGIPASQVQYGATVRVDEHEYTAATSSLAPELLLQSLSQGEPRRFVVYLQRTTSGSTLSMLSIAGNWKAKEGFSGTKLYPARINEIDANGEYWGVIYKVPTDPIHFHGKFKGREMSYEWYTAGSRGQDVFVYQNQNYLSSKDWLLTR